MKYIVFGTIFLFILSISLAVGLTSEQQKELFECKSACSLTEKGSIEICKQDYKECSVDCTGSSCKLACSKDRNVCLKAANNDSRSCQKECRDKYVVKPSCMNGTYEVGEKFTQACEICKCTANGRIDCKRDNFCNNNVSLTASECSSAGGFYHQLCTGPYFSIVCTPKKYCLCEGINNYSCPANYSCVKDFVSPTPRQASYREWATLLGKPLGQVGVCGKPI